MTWNSNKFYSVWFKGLLYISSWGKQKRSREAEGEKKEAFVNRMTVKVIHRRKSGSVVRLQQQIFHSTMLLSTHNYFIYKHNTSLINDLFLLPNNRSTDYTQEKIFSAFYPPPPHSGEFSFRLFSALCNVKNSSTRRTSFELY